MDELDKNVNKIKHLIVCLMKLIYIFIIVLFLESSVFFKFFDWGKINLEWFLIWITVGGFSKKTIKDNINVIHN